MKKQNLWWTILLLMMFVSLGTLQAQTTYETITYSNGAKYVGEFKDDKMHGQGTITHSDGIKYVGEWKNAKMHGKGTITTPDGRELKGVFIDGELVGRQ